MHPSTLSSAGCFCGRKVFLDTGLFKKSTIRGFRVRIPRHFVINGRYAIFVFVVVFFFLNGCFKLRRRLDQTFFPKTFPRCNSIQHRPSPTRIRSKIGRYWTELLEAYYYYSLKILRRFRLALLSSGLFFLASRRSPVNQVPESCLESGIHGMQDFPTFFLFPCVFVREILNGFKMI